MLTKQGIEQSKTVIKRLEGDLQNLDRIKEITKKMESDKAFLTFVNGTQIGKENLSKWVELSKIIIELQSLLRTLRQSTDQYLDNQTAYNDGNYGSPTEEGYFRIQPIGLPKIIEEKPIDNGGATILPLNPPERSFDKVLYKSENINS